MRRAALASSLVALFAGTRAAADGSDWLSAEAALVPPKDGEARLAVGQPFSVAIVARHPPGGLAILPEALALGDALAERRPARRHQRSRDGDVEVDRYELELLAFDEGAVELPSIPLAFGSTQASTRPLSLEIESSLDDKEQEVLTSTDPAAAAELEKMAAPNPAPRAITVPDPRPIWALAALAALVVLGLVARAIVRRVRRRRAAEGMVPKGPPPRPAHEVALERLEALRSAGHLGRGGEKAYYVELSEILRAYVGQRYSFDSVELTVPELVSTLRGLRTPGLELASLARLLEEADLVKFAKYVPTDVEAHSALNGAFELVERTAPRPEAEARAEPAKRSHAAS